MSSSRTTPSGSSAAPARRGPIVIKVGGAMLDEPSGSDALIDVLREPRDAPGVVLVHGGGKAVDRQLARLGMTTERREGIRITPPEQMEQIAGVLAGSMNTALVGALSARGIPAVGLTLSDGFTCRVQLSRRYAFDAGRVGEIVDGDPRLIRHLLAGGFMPVLSSIGTDPAGEALNVNADDAAAAVARILGASSLLLLTDVPGVLGPDGRLVESLDGEQADAWIADGTISAGMIVKVRGAFAAVDAAAGEVGSVVIASWNDSQALRRLLDGRPAGTRFAAGSAGTTGRGPHAHRDGGLCAKDA